jgi:hypothetical protein
MIRTGLYRHFKGNLYEVTGTALHTENGEVLVLYHALGDPNQTFARPLIMFMDTVDNPTLLGGIIPRFKFEKTL